MFGAESPSIRYKIVKSQNKPGVITYKTPEGDQVTVPTSGDTLASVTLKDGVGIISYVGIPTQSTSDHEVVHAIHMASNTSVDDAERQLDTLRYLAGDFGAKSLDAPKYFQVATDICNVILLRTIGMEVVAHGFERLKKIERGEAIHYNKIRLNISKVFGSRNRTCPQGDVPGIRFNQRPTIESLVNYLKQPPKILFDANEVSVSPKDVREQSAIFLARFRTAYTLDIDQGSGIIYDFKADPKVEVATYYDNNGTCEVKVSLTYPALKIEEVIDKLKRYFSMSVLEVGQELVDAHDKRFTLSNNAVITKLPEIFSELQVDLMYKLDDEESPTKAEELTALLAKEEEHLAATTNQHDIRIYAQSLLYLGREEEAIAAYSRIGKLSGIENVVCAFFKTKQEDYAGALAHLQKVKSKHTEVNLARATLEYREGNSDLRHHEENLEHFKSASPAVNKFLGMVAFNEGKYDAAENYFMHAAELDGTDEAVQIGLLQTKSAKGEAINGEISIFYHTAGSTIPHERLAQQISERTMQVQPHHYSGDMFKLARNV